MQSIEAIKFFEFIGFDIYDWTLVFAIFFLLLEIIDDYLEKRLNKRHSLEILANFVTLIPFYLGELIVFAIYVFLGFKIYEAIPWKIPVTLTTGLIALFLTDFIYYVEHFAAHKIRLLWVAHSVHHSSPIMNISTAFRFSLFDPLLSALFHFPLFFLGFHPVLIFAGEVIVQAYQFWIHNEMIGKLGPLEWILNTPSHHRVHHGVDEEYLDKNFGGILIIFDRAFGTFQEETHRPTYGTVTPVDSVHPVKIQFHDLSLLIKKWRSTKGWKKRLKLLYRM